MGKYTGYDVMHNISPGARFVQPDWSATKAGATRRVKQMFEVLQNSSRYGERTAKLTVIAVDPDTGEIITGKMEV